MDGDVKRLLIASPSFCSTSSRCLDNNIVDHRLCRLPSRERFSTIEHYSLVNAINHRGQYRKRKYGLCGQPYFGKRLDDNSTHESRSSGWWRGETSWSFHTPLWRRAILASS
jgi:hypothetical protein